MDIILLFILTVLCHNVGMMRADTLYAADDHITHLDIHNFDSSLAQKPYGWVVEYYATWCGHCQRFAPVYRDFANDISDWSNVIRVAAIACSDPKNLPACRNQNIRGFPTVKFYPPNMETVTRGFKLAPLRFHVPNIRSSTLQFIDSYVTRSRGSFPNVQRYPSLRGLLEDARSKASTHVFAIVDDSSVNSDLAKEVIMDMSSEYPRILVGRLLKSAILDQDVLWQPLPVVVSIGLRDNRVRFVTQLNTREDVTRVLRTLSSRNWRPDSTIAVTPVGSLPVQVVTQPSHHHREPLVRPTGQEIPLVIPLQTSTTMIPDSINADILPHADHKPTIRTVSRPVSGPESGPKSGPQSEPIQSPVFRLTSTDIDSNIYYMLWNEVPSRTRIRGGALSAFKRYLAVLAKYHPSGDRLHSFLDTLYNWINRIGGSLDSTLYLNTMEGLQTNDSHVVKDLTWSACDGSEDRYRGYPCSLWMTFHAITVAAYEHHLQHPNEPFDPMEVLGAIRSYIRHFLGCRDCANHFHKMARRMEQEVSRPEDVILWLWWGHNRVNNRLHGDETEDPRHPKIQFPGPSACPTCRHGNGPFDRFNNESNWNIPAVLDYLREFYGRENILGYISAVPTVMSSTLPTRIGSVDRDDAEHANDMSAVHHNNPSHRISGHTLPTTGVPPGNSPHVHGVHRDRASPDDNLPVYNQHDMSNTHIQRQHPHGNIRLTTRVEPNQDDQQTSYSLGHNPTHARVTQSHNGIAHSRLRTIPPSRSTAAPSIDAVNISCVAMTTPWSVCTTSCNTGISTRLSNSNTRCAMELEARVCQIRPCSFSIGNPMHNGNQCTANMRSEVRSNLTFNGCTTKKAYKWRFCNRCHGYCCKPANDGTFWADVSCQHGNEVVSGAMQISWIVSCDCTLGSCDEH